MSELRSRIEELFVARMHCSQIMLLLSQEMRSLENPELIRAMGGLGGGLYCRLTCGTLLGGCALIASYGAECRIGEEPKFPYKDVIRELVGWFEGEFGSTQCGELVEDDRGKRVAFCPGLLEATFTKCMELLVGQGIDPND